MRIRKQVYNLTLEDLERFPVWEHALDEECEEGQDEAIVRPYEFSPPLDPAEGMLVARATFTLCDGSTALGYLYPQPSGWDEIYQDTPLLALLQPIIVLDEGRMMFWSGIIAPDTEYVSSMYRLLGKSANEVFPLSFQSDVELKDGPVKGTIPGFLYYAMEKKSFFSRKQRVVKEIR